MKEHRLTEEYTTAFRAFLDHTKEKQDLFAALERRIVSAEAHSLLDIGVGNGDLAIPLSKLVHRYVAVEANLEFAMKLQANGIEVINAAFPHQIEGTFDIVVASHVVPWEENESKAFLQAAWRRVGPRGRFIMITYDEEQGDWGELLRLSGLPTETVGQGHFAGYQKLLEFFGRLEMEPVVTHVTTNLLDEMLRALSFVYGDGMPEKARRFQENTTVRYTLQTRYRNHGEYEFPFTHYLLQAEKSE